jgi:hypothetical protein
MWLQHNNKAMVSNNKNNKKHDGEYIDDDDENVGDDIVEGSDGRSAEASELSGNYYSLINSKLIKITSIFLKYKDEENHQNQSASHRQQDYGK